MNLSEEQQKAVYANDRFIFLLASAGSGKTTVIIERIRYLLNQGVNPEDILSITFTRKAAREMVKRLNREDVCIQTFHRFCLDRLQLDFKQAYDIEDGKNIPFSKETLLNISVYKNKGKTGKAPFQYKRYEQMLQSQNKKDFDDVLLDFLTYVQQNKKQYHYQYIFIDEFQDTNDVQYNILKVLVNYKTSVFAVGDPDQSIYKFRGACTNIIEKYIDYFKAEVYSLNTNYRSDQNIIQVANALILNNRRVFKKSLNAFHQHKGHLEVMTFIDEDEEARHIIELVKQLNKKKIKYNEIAILYRIHRRAYTLKYALLDHNVHFQFYEDDRDVYTYTDHVQLLSVHKAKGLEFDVVIVLGLEDQIFPMKKEMTKKETEEERRLMFVAMTRARHHLYLTNVQINSLGRRVKSSLFIEESTIKSL
jgi:DNA helicase II / ATP-dependent DNA helicase PcrA